MTLTVKQEVEEYYEKLVLEYCMTPTWCVKRLDEWIEKNKPKCLLEFEKTMVRNNG